MSGGRWAWCLAIGVAIGACGKTDQPSSPREGVIAAWKQAGLTPSAFAPLTSTIGGDCAAGTVGGLDALLCVYHSPTEAQQASEAGFSWIGSATGSSQAHGSVLIVVADRKKADPNGKTINQLMKLAPS